SLGAMSRFRRVLEPISAYAGNVIQPKCARTVGRRNFIRLLTRIGLGTTAVVIFIIAGGIVGGDTLLWLLGESYSGLNHELSIYFFAMALNYLISMLVVVNQSKGWIHYSSLANIPLSLAAMAIGAIYFGVTTISGVLLMAICSRIPALGLQSADMW